MNITDSLKKRFVKDYNLPISIYEEPYFEYFINLYSNLNAKEKYNDFISLVERVGGESQFFLESKKIIEQMIENINSNEHYKDFQSFDLGSISLSHKFSDSNILFNSGNHNKWFTSIDLVKANWQSFRYFNKELVSNKNSYFEWASQFTNEKYYINSKQIRQIVFGNLNPKRQQSMQRRMIDAIWGKLDEDLLNVVGATSDELIIQHGDSCPEQSLSGYISDIINEFDVNIKVFNLKRIEDKPFYKKEYLDGTFELKCIPSHNYAEVYKRVIGVDTNHMDRTTMFEGRVVLFVKPLFEDI